MNKEELPYGEDINYWQTSRSSSDSWIDKTSKQIQKSNGSVLAEAFGKDASGVSAFMFVFEIEGDRFKIVWPILPSKTNNERAAKIQAATMLYHDVKAKCISATVLGVRVAFFSYLLLSDGRTTTDFETDEIRPMLDNLFGTNTKQLKSGDMVIDGEYRNQ